MASVKLLWHGYRYFPYERAFATREVEGLLGGLPRSVRGGVEVDLDGHPPHAAKRLTYFREAILPGGEVLSTDQALLEASARAGEEGGNGAARPLGRRQSTRYSAHGIHEYRGKFNPQVVRAIGNMLSIPSGGWILDPFCGSGTTVLESAHSGWNACGIDLNPLGVLISTAKVRALRASPKKLRDSASVLEQALLRRIRGASWSDPWSESEMERIGGRRWQEQLPNFDHLSRWFPLPVLAQLAVILREIDTRVPPSLRLIFRVILSDIIRSVSYQDPGDLRIRRRKDPQPNYPAIPRFLETMWPKLGAAIGARQAIGPPRGVQRVFLGDSRRPLEVVTDRAGAPCFDAVITSPPYATALPYVDTQRLSLLLLGLVRADELRHLERDLVGSREIAESWRRRTEAKIATAPEPLPASVHTLCARMLELSRDSGDGFRRRNMPALVFSYFSDMAKVFANVRSVTREGGYFALVVGRNQTKLRDQSFVIDTPSLLADLAPASGWHVRSLIKMDTYQRFDVHSRNSIRSESLLVLRAA